MIKFNGKYTQVVESLEDLPKGIIIIPERKLLGAALVRAYLDIYRYRKRADKSDLYKLSEWFDSDDLEQPFGFLWCCYHFDPDWQTLPSLMRKAIKEPRVNKILMRSLRKTKK